MASKAQKKFLIGTSGWSYYHWKEIFYPPELPSTRWFDYYSKVFSTVEINATFYRNFKDKTFEKWRDQARKKFKYVLKAPKTITHIHYLKDVNDEIKEFWRKASILEDWLGLILLQLAPKTSYEPALLKDAILAFGDPSKVAVEFRNKQWLTDEIKKLLSEINAVFCNADSPKSELVDWVTSTEAAYIRLHGRKRWYSHDYSDAELENIAGLAKKFAQKTKKVYVFFNNDVGGYAVKNALRLAELLGLKTTR